MCIIIQRYYQCRTRAGVGVNTEAEEWNRDDDKSHYPGRFIIRCSTPLMIPELPEDGRGFDNVNNSNILPCWGTMDLKTEWYDHPCPECRGEGPYLDDPPISETFVPYFADMDEYGHSEDRETCEEMDRATDRAAEALAKTLFCWISIHWMTDSMYPSNAHKRDIAKEMISTQCDMVCVKRPSHGTPVPPLGCSACHLNQNTHQRNAATAIRQTLSRQTSIGHYHFTEWVDFIPFDVRFGGRLDLYDAWRTVPNDEWNRDPFFEFAVDAQGLPDFQRRIVGSLSPLFGIDAAVVNFNTRVLRLQHWEDRQNPPPLDFVPLFSSEEVNCRLKLLYDQITLAMGTSLTDKGWNISMAVLLQVAEILAHDTGLMDYRMGLIMHDFLEAYKRNAHPIDQSDFGNAPIRRPPFEPPYLDAIFKLIVINQTEIASRRPFEYGDGSGIENGGGEPFSATGMNMRLRMLEPMYDPGNPMYHHENRELRIQRLNFPHWVVPESSDERKAEIQRWRLQYVNQINILWNRTRATKAHVVKFIPGLISENCTRCNAETGERRRGAQLCALCEKRTGYAAGRDVFGDALFLKRTETEAGPVASWSCCFCGESFDKDEPPFEWAGDSIRCHGTHNVHITGSLCLQIRFADNAVDAGGRHPVCPFDRKPLTIEADDLYSFQPEETDEEPDEEPDEDPIELSP